MTKNRNIDITIIFFVEALELIVFVSCTTLRFRASIRAYHSSLCPNRGPNMRHIMRSGSGSVTLSNGMFKIKNTLVYKHTIPASA